MVHDRDDTVDSISADTFEVEFSRIFVTTENLHTTTWTKHLSHVVMPRVNNEAYHGQNVMYLKVTQQHEVVKSHMSGTFVMTCFRKVLIRAA